MRSMSGVGAFADAISTYDGIRLERRIFLCVSHALDPVKLRSERVAQSSRLCGLVPSYSNNPANALGDSGLLGDDEVLDLARPRDMAVEMLRQASE